MDNLPNNLITAPAEELQSNSANKRLFIIIGIMAFILALLTVLFLIFAKRSALKEAPTLTQQPIKPLTLPTMIPTQVPVDPTNWTTHKTSQYTLTYPPNWKPQELQIVGGGTIFTVRPATAANGDYFPRIDVESYPTNPKVTLQQKADFLSGYKLTKTSTTFHGIPAIQLSGTMAIKLDVGNPQQKPIHKTIIFLEKSGWIYEIKYAYYEDLNEQQTLRLINNALDTLKL